MYELALGFQIVLYTLAASTALHAKAGVLSRLSNISLAFILLNTAAAVALFYFLTGRKSLWAR
jgi:hypothetical protein